LALLIGYVIYRIFRLVRPKVSLNTYTAYLACLALTQVGCAHSTSRTIGWTDNGAPIVRSSSSYPLLDNRGILHEYRDSKAYPKIIKPTHNDELTIYCGSHFQWETVKIVWKRGNLVKIEHREEIDYWRWNYNVTRNKKQ
jgi:hypothetical protein